MSMAPPIVDNNGDINLHYREGGTILLTIPGVSAGVLQFKIDGQANLSLTATGNANEYSLVIPQTSLAAMSTNEIGFTLIVTGGATPVVWWEGVLRRRGAAT